MSYLRFDKPLMTNLQESLPKELLRTNKSGAYSCSSIVDCNTRKYHGLLVVPVPEMDDDNHVLLVSENKEAYQPFKFPTSDIRSLAIVVGLIRAE